MKTILFFILIIFMFCPFSVSYGQTSDLGYTVYRGINEPSDWAWYTEIKKPYQVDPNYNFNRYLPNNNLLTGDDVTSAWSREYWLTPFNINTNILPPNILASEMWDALAEAVKWWSTGDDPVASIALTLGEEIVFDIGWDTYNNVLFRDDFDAQGISAKAITIIYVEITEYQPNQYHAEIVESDIILNKNDISHNWNINGNMDYDNNLDLQSVITHELGHTIGVGHSFLGKQMVNGSISPPGTIVNPITENDWPTMWQSSVWTNTQNSFITLPTDQLRTLAQDDINACIWLYNSNFNPLVFPTENIENIYKSAYYWGQDIRIPQNACVQIRDEYELRMEGGLVSTSLTIEEGACLEILGTGCLDLNGVELIIDPLAACNVSPNGCLEIYGEAGCVLIKNDGEFTIKSGNNIVIKDEGFMILDGGTLILEDNARLIFENTSNRFEIRPGSTIILGENASIEVNSKIEAQGTSKSPITFASMYTNPTTDKYWTWLKITGNGIGGEPPENVLHNVNIESADYGLYLYNTNADIQYSTFQYNRYSNVILGNSDAYFYSNTIKNTISGHGISLNNSSPDFYGNLISDNQGTGIDCYNYSSPKFGSTTSSDEGKNIVRNNNPGILASYYSNPFLGDWDGEENRIGGYNSIYDNGEYAVQAEDNSGITAQFNWWGDYPVSKEIFYSDETSKIVYANALNFDPNEMIMAKITNGNSYHRGFISNNPNDPRLLLRLARCYRYQKRPVLALGVYKQLINNYPNHREARWGLIEILEAFTEAGQDSSVNFLQRIRNIHPNGKMKRVASDLLSAVFIEKGKTSAAIANCQQIVSNYPDTESEKTALFDLFCIYLNTLRDSSQAQGALSVMEQKYPGDQLTIFAQYQMGRPGGTSAQLTKVSPTAEKQTPNFPQANPNIFQLSQNYPNPFNPQTQIRFALPQQANVKLTIYDVSGRQVRTLVNENMPAGYHTAVWNGRNDNGAQVGTGVYFYHITAGDPSTGSGQRFSQVRKMLLVR